MNQTAQVNHPEHYKSDGGMEVINIIEGFHLDHHRANAIKYILRADRKGNFDQDIAKAAWYLLRLLINHRQRGQVKQLLHEYRLEGVNEP